MKKYKRILLAIQKQSGKPIFLYENGEVVCGNFTYKGRYQKRFAEIYQKIFNLVDHKNKIEIDVSKYKYWSAIEIYDNYIILNWIKSVSAHKIESFAKQTIVTLLVNEIKEEFIRAVSNKWKRMVLHVDSNNSDYPKDAWNIL